MFSGLELTFRTYKKGSYRGLTLNAGPAEVISMEATNPALAQQVTS
jgi:hypothetical protein